MNSGHQAISSRSTWKQPDCGRRPTGSSRSRPCGFARPGKRSAFSSRSSTRNNRSRRVLMRFTVSPTKSWPRLGRPARSCRSSWRFWAIPSSSRLIAHNASFDAGFLGSELRRAGLDVPGHSLYDTLALSRSRLPMLESHRLDSIARHFGLDPAGAHRAMADSLLVKEIWLRLGGHRECDRSISFRMFDARKAVALPEGWEALEQAVERGCDLRIEYEGGTRGTAPRSITPRRLESRGGSTFLVAHCHLDSLEKSFRVDRILSLEFTSETGQELVRVERRASGG